MTEGLKTAGECYVLPGTMSAKFCILLKDYISFSMSANSSNQQR